MMMVIKMMIIRAHPTPQTLDIRKYYIIIFHLQADLLKSMTG